MWIMVPSVEESGFVPKLTGVTTAFCFSLMIKCFVSMQFVIQELAVPRPTFMKELPYLVHLRIKNCVVDRSKKSIAQRAGRSLLIHRMNVENSLKSLRK